MATVTVIVDRKDGCNKYLRIYRLQKGYSLLPADNEESTTLFSTLAELVDFYKSHSLATFNKRLGVYLQNAVSKPAPAASSQYHVFRELYDLSQERVTAQAQLSALQKQQKELDSKVRMLELMVPSLELVQQMYFDSLIRQTELEAQRSTGSAAKRHGVDLQWLHREQSLRESGGGVEQDVSGETQDKEKKGSTAYTLSPEEEKKLADNSSELLCRYKAVGSRLQSVRTHFATDSVRLRKLESRIQYVELTLANMRVRHDELVRHMVVLGCEKEFVNQVLEPPEATREFNSGSWLVHCTREEAVNRLRALPHGAFLVRQKDNAQLPYVLSVVVSTRDDNALTTQHCYIVRPPGRGFGFNAVLAIFDSVEELVLRHRYVSLKHYIKDLDVMLSFPVGCEEMVRLSLAPDKKTADVPDGVYANTVLLRQVARK